MPARKFKFYATHPVANGLIVFQELLAASVCCICCHVTSSVLYADGKADILGSTIYLPSLVVIAFIFLELRGVG